MVDIQTDWLVLLIFPFSIIPVFLAHEFGHYIMAKIYGVRVETFTIGCGKIIWERTDKYGTLWSIRMFPICGLIHLAGKSHKVPISATFDSKSLWQRTLIVLAGPLGNISFSLCVFIFLFMFIGQASVPPYITGVEVDKNAYKAGFQAGDRVLEIDGKNVKRYEDVTDITRHVTDIPLAITLQRDNEIIKTTVISSLMEYENTDGFKRSHGRLGVQAMHRPLALKSVASVNGIDSKDDEDKARELLLINMDKEIIIGTDSVDGEIHYYIVNISSDINYDINNPESRGYKHVYMGKTAGNFYLKHSLTESSAKSVKETGRLISGIFHSIRKPWAIDRELITPETNASSRDSVWKARVYRIMSFMAFVSICIGLINFIPIPGFDGSVLVLLIAEALRGPVWVEANKHYVLMAALGLLYGSVAISHLVV